MMRSSRTPSLSRRSIAAADETPVAKMGSRSNTYRSAMSPGIFSYMTRGTEPGETTPESFASAERRLLISDSDSRATRRTSHSSRSPSSDVPSGDEAAFAAFATRPASPPGEAESPLPDPPAPRLSLFAWEGARPPIGVPPELRGTPSLSLRSMSSFPILIPLQQARRAFSIASPERMMETPQIFLEKHTPS